ncbi:hypothetical protein EVAR_70004_1 [Eumeta japonica]|uniref:Uncharacterized protein n=1 Tax=Eumeta variegata TaxID=151549 RepID=A0A4C2ADB8_EUMVA|nr:hypothetical protein EVAR_70004_1 [Eumeta japonica]
MTHQQKPIALFTDLNDEAASEVSQRARTCGQTRLRATKEYRWSPSPIDIHGEESESRELLVTGQKQFLHVCILGLPCITGRAAHSRRGGIGFGRAPRLLSSSKIYCIKLPDRPHPPDHVDVLTMDGGSGVARAAAVARRQQRAQAPPLALRRRVPQHGVSVVIVRRPPTHHVHRPLTHKRNVTRISFCFSNNSEVTYVISRENTTEKMLPRVIQHRYEELSSRHLVGALDHLFADRDSRLALKYDTCNAPIALQIDKRVIEASTKVSWKTLCRLNWGVLKGPNLNSRYLQAFMKQLMDTSDRERRPEIAPCGGPGLCLPFWQIGVVYLHSSHTAYTQFFTIKSNKTRTSQPNALNLKEKAFLNVLSKPRCSFSTGRKCAPGTDALATGVRASIKDLCNYDTERGSSTIVAPSGRLCIETTMIYKLDGQTYLTDGVGAAADCVYTQYNDTTAGTDHLPACVMTLMPHLFSGISPTTAHSFFAGSYASIDDCPEPPNAYSLLPTVANAKPHRAVRIGAIGVHVSVWKRQGRKARVKKQVLWHYFRNIRRNVVSDQNVSEVFKKRTAEATGVSRTTARAISDDHEASASSGTSRPAVNGPKKALKSKEHRLSLDDFDYQVIRRKISDIEGLDHLLAPTTGATPGTNIQERAGIIVKEKLDNKLPLTSLIEIVSKKLGSTVYSGPTHMSIRSGQHASSTADIRAFVFESLLSLPVLKPLTITESNTAKAAIITFVDGGPDENPRCRKDKNFTIRRFNKCILDAVHSH